MASKQLVFVEINPDTDLPIRIVKYMKDALDVPPERLRQMAKKVAVGYIREQVINRARRGKTIQCEFCGMTINEFTGEMHEQIPKGDGGEVSLDNCKFLCYECHQGKYDSEHGDRRWGGKTT